MNAILGFTELLKRGFGRDSVKTQKHLEIIHSSGKHLLELINDILDLSKVESGHLEIERVRFNPYSVIVEVVKVLGVRAGQKDIRLELKIPDDVPETIIGDSGRIRQIVTNLVGNAVKFTEHGSVTVTASAERLAEDMLQFHIDIADTGVGMSPEATSRIFGPHYSRTGHIVYGVGGTLRAVSFDLDQLAVTGAPVSVLEGVMTKSTEFGNPGQGGPDLGFDVLLHGHGSSSPGTFPTFPYHMMPPTARNNHLPANGDSSSLWAPLRLSTTVARDYTS